MSEVIADLQIHSKYSRAVSPKMDLFEISRWASCKGLDLVATGDWTHPLWQYQLTSELKEVRPGIFQLKNPPPEASPERSRRVNFLLSTEISSIYSQGGQTRRVHNLIFVPSIETVKKFTKALQSRGANLTADGRPIVGLSSKDLLALMLEIDDQSLFIPAHAWTPWFALYGSMSGFDSIDECFEDLSSHIYAIETGLSSDPHMNWQVKELDQRSIVSFSDAHSGPKLGREATVFIGSDDFTFADLAAAIKQEPGKLKIGYTIEFFPEEGKYHWSGHRDHSIRYSPEEVAEKGKTCPVCKRSLTIGVENRVRDLSGRIIKAKELIIEKDKNGVSFVHHPEKNRPPFVSLVPLQEILREVEGGSPTKAERQFLAMTQQLGTEFEILLKKPLTEIARIGGQRLAEAIEIVRNRQVTVEPGYDGVYGAVKIFNEQTAAQPSLF